MKASPEAVYRERREAFAAEERRLARRSFQLSFARFATFAGGALCLFFVLLDAGSPAPGWIAGAAACFAAFLALVAVHDRVVKEQRRFQELVRINEEGLARLERDWQRLPVPAQPPLGDPPPLARDLNLFGPASLFHLLGTVHTPPGKAALARWLLAPADPEEIARRQQAVAELAPDLDLRQKLELLARPMESAPPDCEPFLRWAEDRPWLLERRGLLALARALAAVPLLLLAAAVAGLPVPLWSVLLLIMVNLAVARPFGERIEATFNRIGAREGELRRYAEVLELLADRRFESERLQGITRDLAVEDLPAHRWLALLDRRVALADSRHSTLLHTPLQLLFLWDFHVLWLLERWQEKAGRRTRRWLAALGDAEALSALGGLAWDNPEWAVPGVARGGPPLVEARDLGHPLLPPARRVGNDVAVGPPGTFLLVTGSNMSGKSTLLRAIGLNVVLAQAGGPVCAREMSLPPLDLATSILVEDSLTDGVSFFLAELQRIRQVVDAADRAAAEGKTLLYLLDEVLRGTNSAERQVAVRRVLSHLLARGALGAVSTHDLELAGLPELQDACRPVHFQESYEQGEDRRPRMTFDYQLRPGVATTTNALKLLDLVGLPFGSWPRP